MVYPQKERKEKRVHHCRRVKGKGKIVQGREIEIEIEIEIETSSVQNRVRQQKFTTHQSTQRIFSFHYPIESLCRLVK